MKKTFFAVMILLGLLVVQSPYAQGKNNKVHQLDVKPKPVNSPPKPPTPAPRQSPGNKRVQN